MVDDSTFLLQLNLYAFNSDLIIIQKLIIMHTHSHTHTHTEQRCCLQNQQQQADSRQSAVVVQLQQAAAVAESWLHRGQGSSCNNGDGSAQRLPAAAAYPAKTLTTIIGNSIILNETNSNLIFLLF